MQITYSHLQQMFRKREEYAYLRIGSKKEAEQMISNLVGSVQPPYPVEKGPPDLVERASKWLCSIYEQKIYRSH